MIAIVMLFSTAIFAQQKEKIDTSIAILDKDGNVTYYIYPDSCKKCKIDYPVKKPEDVLITPINLITIKRKDNA